MNNCRYGTKLALNFNADLVQIIIKINRISADIAPSNGAIWDEFSDQHYH